MWGFVFLFLAHALAVLRFSERPLPPTPIPTSRPFFYLSLDENSDRRVTELTLGRDPTLFALPHANDFSGSAWQSFHPDLPKLTNWSPPPEWLALSDEQLGLTLHEFVMTNRTSEAELMSRLRMPNAVEVRVPDLPVMTNTVVRIEGPVAARQLVAAPTLPSAVHADVLRWTVVLISVNGEGVVEGAAVASESGSKAADDRAVELARQFAFAPAAIREVAVRDAAPPTIGRLVFTWHVIAPSASAAATASTP